MPQHGLPVTLTVFLANPADALTRWDMGIILLYLKQKNTSCSDREAWLARQEDGFSVEAEYESRIHEGSRGMRAPIVGFYTQGREIAEHRCRTIAQIVILEQAIAQECHYQNGVSLTLKKALVTLSALSQFMGLRSFRVTFTHP